MTILPKMRAKMQPTVDEERELQEALDLNSNIKPLSSPICDDLEVLLGAVRESIIILYLIPTDNLQKQNYLLQPNIIAGARVLHL